MLFFSSTVYHSLSVIVWMVTAQNWNKLSSHTHPTLHRSGWPWGSGALNPSPHSWIFYFRLSGFQSSLLHIHFCYGPNTCLHYTQEWYRISSICDSPLQTPVRRSFTYRNRAKIRSIWVSRKLPTYPSPKLTLTLTSHLGQNDGLGEG